VNHEAAMKELIEELVSLLTNLATIVASGIAIYLFFWKGKYISSVFRVLINYSSQITLSEIINKLDLLNALRWAENKDQEEIINIMHEITGQLKGNPNLVVHFSELIEKIEKDTSSKNKHKLSEPWKRSIVGEIREKVRHVGILGFDEVSGGRK
jgi:hypothetical protein